MFPKPEPVSLPESLHSVLLDLLQRPYPYVSNPPGCHKRASVALVLRVRPTYGHWPDSPPPPSVETTTEKRLENFFSQPWVEHGDPEVLFIKRASRVGDRWTGHVALPGGKRDPEDADDKAAAIRETSEEVGLDLTTDDYLYVGNLPERVVTTSWGSVPLMVLCPFLFLSMRSDSPTLNLQPTEVASTHWVPLRALLSPSTRTVEHVDVSQRLAQRGGFATRLALRSMMGLMRFSAVELVPTESLQSNSAPGLIPEGDAPTPSLYERWKAWCLSNQADSGSRNRPLLLWGLTLGVLADFLEMLPPHNAVELWKYPTFTSPDLRLLISALTCSLRKRNKLHVRSGAPSNTAVDSQTAALAVTETTGAKDNCNDVGIEGLGVGRYYGPTGRSSDGTEYAVGIMLRGYYSKLRTAIYIFLAWRIALGSAGAIFAWKFLRQRQVIERIATIISR